MAEILVIDDSAVARETMAQILSDAGHEVYQHESPLGATALIYKHRVKLVVLDMNMPAMSGERFAQLIRGNANMNHVKLILVSGERQEALYDVGQSVGADAVLRKADLQHALSVTVKRLVTSGDGV